jgi:NAD(P)-dependent dehydrogenase (short-subunit alcohol dehydrogenase family)
MQVNVVARRCCARHAVQAMSTAHGGTGGSLVNAASVAARTTGGISGTVPYGATKGALVTFTRGLSDEVVPEGIGVNSASPGAIATQMSAAVPEKKEAAAHSPPSLLDSQ